MPRWLLNTYAMTQPTAIGTTTPAPNSSTPMIVHASGTFAAPANTATNPTAASSGTGTPSGPASAEPSVAPTTNNGVTSPPGKKQPSVTAVKRILSANTSNPIDRPRSAASDRPSDRPQYFVPNSAASTTTPKPPMTNRNGCQATRRCIRFLIASV